MEVKRSRTSVGRRRSRPSATLTYQLAAAVFGLVFAWPLAALAEPHGGGWNGGGSWSGYQRKGHFAESWHGDWRRDGRQHVAPQVSAGWFQRPYPYHLDYYRMRYGGSYAPYFGNLYGPPNNYFYGSPYYGDYSPYYGFNGYPPNGYPGGYGYGGPNCGGPAGYVEQPSPPADADAAEQPPVIE